jgi:phosphate transport system substrate-binding protein
LKWNLKNRFKRIFLNLKLVIKIVCKHLPILFVVLSLNIRNFKIITSILIKIKMKKTPIIALTLAISLFLNGCGNKHETIHIDGSTTVLPVVTKAADLFKESNPDVTIIINGGGSGVGVNMVGEKKVELGMISRDVEEEEKKKFPDINFIVYPIGRDAVVPVVSSEVYDGGVKSLSFEQIKAIYLGNIKNWKELGGPDREILVIDKEKSRGTREVFAEKVLGNKKADAPGAKLVLGSNNEEQTAVIQSDAAIGMLSNAWLTKDVKGLAIKTNEGVIEPSMENIVNNKYPIERNLSVITNGEATGKLKEFIEFLKGTAGQKIVEESGYVKLYK